MTKKEHEEMTKVQTFMFKNPSFTVAEVIEEVLGCRCWSLLFWPHWARYAYNKAWGSKAVGGNQEIFLAIISERLATETVD